MEQQAQQFDPQAIAEQMDQMQAQYEQELANLPTTGEMIDELTQEYIKDKTLNTDIKVRAISTLVQAMNTLQQMELEIRKLEIEVLKLQSDQALKEAELEIKAKIATRPQPKPAAAQSQGKK